jgi:hypothetical protein
MRKLSFMISLLLVMGMASASLNIQASSETFEVGFSKLLQLTLQNTGNSAIDNIEIAFVYLESPLTSSTCTYCDTQSSITGECLEYESDCFVPYGDLDALGTKEIFYQISVPSTASPKDYLGKIFIKYTSAGSKEMTQTFDITVTDEPSLEFSNKLVGPVYPFEDFYLSFQVKNKEGYPLKNAEVSVLENSNFFAKNSITYLGDIAAGGTKNVNLTMQSGSVLPEGSNYIDVLVSFQDNEGNKYSKTERFNFVVGGESSFDIYVDDVYPSPVSEGAKTTLSIGVLNKGDFEARSSIVEILDNLALEPSRYYVGDIKSEDYETASFNIIPNQVGSMPVRVSLTYLDVFGNVRQENKTISLDVSPAAMVSNTGIPTAYLVGFLITLVVLVYYFYLRKSKGKK